MTNSLTEDLRFFRQKLGEYIDSLPKSVAAVIGTTDGDDVTLYAFPNHFISIEVCHDDPQPYSIIHGTYDQATDKYTMVGNGYTTGNRDVALVMAVSYAESIFYRLP